jgi:hypothetical protein
VKKLSSQKLICESKTTSSLSIQKVYENYFSKALHSKAPLQNHDARMHVEHLVKAINLS